MAFETDCRQWAEELFGGCDLGDVRRTDRLVDYVARQAADPAASIAGCCRLDPAAREGAYRLLRNANVESDAISDGVCDRVAEQADAHAMVLAIQDSTGISFGHPGARELAEQGNPTGFVVHATLLVDADTHEAIGVADLERWIRPPQRAGRDTYKQRPYAEKESFKWEAASERLRGRVSDPRSFITVCDREADIYEFIQYQLRHGLRFVVRGCSNRYLKPYGRLWDCLGQRPVMGTRVVQISQRGGQRARGTQRARSSRHARDAQVSVRAAAVVLDPPTRKLSERQPLPVNAVLVREEKPPKDTKPLEWMLLTTEPTTSMNDAERVIQHYEARWLIEEYFKAWKSGCRVQQRTLQTAENLERIVVITAHIAVRLLQLRWLSEQASVDSCEVVLEEPEWQCLHASLSPGQPLPTQPPSTAWALDAIARLGGWTDSKRTGQVGWSTLWKGWRELESRVVGWRVALNCIATK